MALKTAIENLSKIIDEYNSVSFTEEFKKENFVPIALEDNAKIAFIDGGNLAVIETPSFAVHLVRIYYNIFAGVKRLNPKFQNKFEFFAVIKNDGKDYITEFLPLQGEISLKLKIDICDKELSIGTDYVKIQSVTSAIRAVCEWYYTKQLASELDSDDIIVKDGSLVTKSRIETKYADIAYKTAIAKKILLCGVAKTSELFTMHGMPLTTALLRFAEFNNIPAPWRYPSLETDFVSTYIAKLNKHSEYAFRVDTLKKQNSDRIFANLAFNSTDISFPGYPYGLIDADKHARITYKEVATLKALLRAKTKELEKANDAHEWLNKIV